jgi:1-hydroxycarotenoid 3,4-desaturase
LTPEAALARQADPAAQEPAGTRSSIRRAAAQAAGDTQPVIVVGAGIGGLAAALRLASQGLPVTVVERGTAPGGKMRALTVDGAEIDAGPTVFTMRWVFDELLAELDTRLEDLVQLTPLSVLARHVWRQDGAQLDLHADANASAQAIAKFSSPAEARRFTAFCDEARRIYRRLEGPHIRSSRPGLGQMITDLGWSGVRELAALGPFASMWRSLGRHFHDPRLQQLFGRYATYCGASPWLAPATLMLVAHVEMAGVWSINGGMAGLAQRLAELAQRRGVRLIYGQAVTRITTQAGRASGVRLADGSHLAASQIIFNGDARALSRGLLGADAAGAVTVREAASDRSLSAVTWAMHVRTRGLPLARHNVFFDTDYRSEFDDVFRRRRLPRHGTVYLCAQDRTHDGAAAPAGSERLLALVNAPADGDRHALDPTELEACEQRSLNLMRSCGLELDITQPARQILRRAPWEFNQLYPGSGGALYGPATHGWMALFRRPSARTTLTGLYLAGGSVHPGPGVPMAAMSGRLAAATLMADRDSMRRSSRVHIAGGMWTPSATTAATP